MPRTARDAAEAKLREYSGKLDQATKEIDELHAAIIREGEQEKERIIAEAKIAAEKIVAQAALSAEQENVEGPHRTACRGCPSGSGDCNRQADRRHSEERPRSICR